MAGQCVELHQVYSSICTHTYSMNNSDAVIKGRSQGRALCEALSSRASPH